LFVSGFVSPFLFDGRFIAITAKLTDILAAIAKFHATGIAPAVARVGIAIAFTAIGISAAFFTLLISAFLTWAIATITWAIFTGFIVPTGTIATKGLRLRTIRFILCTGAIIIVITFPGRRNALTIVASILIGLASLRLSAAGLTAASLTAASLTAAGSRPILGGRNAFPLEALVTIGAVPIGVTAFRFQNALSKLRITIAGTLFTAGNRLAIANALTCNINTGMLQAGIPLGASRALRCSACGHTTGPLHTKDGVSGAISIGLTVGHSTGSLKGITYARIFVLTLIVRHTGGRATLSVHAFHVGRALPMALTATAHADTFKTGFPWSTPRIAGFRIIWIRIDTDTGVRLTGLQGWMTGDPLTEGPFLHTETCAGITDQLSFAGQPGTRVFIIRIVHTFSIRVGTDLSHTTGDALAEGLRGHAHTKRRIANLPRTAVDACADQLMKGVGHRFLLATHRHHRQGDKSDWQEP